MSCLNIMSESMAKGAIWLPCHYSTAVVPQLPADTGSSFAASPSGIYFDIMWPCPAAGSLFLKQQES